MYGRTREREEGNGTEKRGRTASKGKSIEIWDLGNWKWIKKRESMNKVWIGVDN